MAEFDTISKYLIQTYPDQFAHFSLGREDVDVLEVLNTEQPTVEVRHTDSLLRVRLDDEVVLVHNEFQTTDSTHPSMPRRMAGYIGRAIEHHGVPVYSSVLYLRPDAGQTDPGQYLQAHPDHQVFIKYKVIRLSELDGQRILDAGHLGLMAFAPLMKPPEAMDAEAWLRQCIHTARERSMEDRSAQANLLAGMSLLSGLVYASATISDIILQEGIMDLIRESSFAQYLTQQGIEQGLQESILDVLELRFDPSEAQQLVGRIEALDDVQRLKQLHRAAIQVPNLEAFRDLLDAAE